MVGRTLDNTKPTGKISLLTGFKSFIELSRIGYKLTSQKIYSTKNLTQSIFVS